MDKVDRPGLNLVSLKLNLLHGDLNFTIFAFKISVASQYNTGAYSNSRRGNYTRPHTFGWESVEVIQPTQGLFDNNQCNGIFEYNQFSDQLKLLSTWCITFLNLSYELIMYVNDNIHV